MRDNLARKIDTLAMSLEGKDNTMIDPVEFGEVKGAVASLQAQMTDIKARQASIDGKLDIIVSQLDHARGGWKMLMLLGGSGASFGAWVAYVFMGGPKP